jgi:hypothetical protein
LTVAGSATVIYEFDNLVAVYGADGTLTLDYSALTHGWGANYSCVTGRLQGKDAAGNVIHTWPLVLIFDCNQQNNGYSYTIQYNAATVLPALATAQFQIDATAVGQCNQM